MGIPRFGPDRKCPKHRGSKISRPARKERHSFQTMGQTREAVSIHHFTHANWPDSTESRGWL